MNKIERVRAALRGEQVDRIPASFWFHFPQDQAAGQAMADIHLAYYRAVDPDWLKVMNDNGYPAPTGSPLKRPDDWRNLRPASLDDPCFQNQLDGLERVVDAIGGEALIITTIFGPYSVGNNLSGRTLTEQLIANPEAVSAGLAAIAETQAAFSLACLEAGASGIFFSAQGGEKDRFQEDVFLRYLKPHDLTVLNAVKDEGEFNLLHICAHNLRLDAYDDYPAAAVNWSTTWENPSLSEGWPLFDAALVGGMDQRGPMVEGDRAAIEAEAAAAAAEVGKERFLLGAGCTLPSDIDWDYIKLAIEAAHSL